MDTARGEYPLFKNVFFAEELDHRRTENAENVCACSVVKEILVCCFLNAI